MAIDLADLASALCYVHGSQTTQAGAAYSAIYNLAAACMAMMDVSRRDAQGH